MWSDNETDKDFLNFTGVAGTVAEIIRQAGGAPVSIGVSGSWGAGKSSMIKLIKADLNKDATGKNPKYVFVEFNAWLYQDYDDARASLMDRIAAKLEEVAKDRATGLDKAQDILDRVNWLRLAKLGGDTALSVAFGMPPAGLLAQMYGLGKDIFTGQVDGGTARGVEEATAKAAAAGHGILKPKVKYSPPKEIHDLRASFEAMLEELDICLVVLIDDLDRCLPETTISTLEAIRLFLFLKNTAFVIAADKKMIMHAVKRHFVGVDDAMAVNYFDKLIQVPITVPPLGTQEVRAYMLMLFIEGSDLAATVKEEIRAKVAIQLTQSWQGKRVDRAFVESLHSGMPKDLIARLDTADRLAHLMATATAINGNPRLIKQFLNALAIRMSISKAHGVGVNETVLAKMLLFERCGDPKAFNELTKAVTNSGDGKADFLTESEKIARGSKGTLEVLWSGEFEKEWLALEPSLADEDLRGVLYVSREHAAVVTPQDRLSSQAADLLTGLLTHPRAASSVKTKLQELGKSELSVVMGRVLDRARQEQEWGTPDILEACLVVASIDDSLGGLLAGFLMERPAPQIKPSIVPKIAGFTWAKQVFDEWVAEGVSDTVKRAIKAA